MYTAYWAIPFEIHIGRDVVVDVTAGQKKSSEQKIA